MLTKIVNAHRRLSGIANKTPVFTSRTLNSKINAEIFVKCENFQRVGAFKFRGAYNALSQLSNAQKNIGVVTHSSGNHAQAIALAGKLLQIPTSIVMPENAPKVKINATRGYGAQVVFCESTQEAREKTCNDLIDEKGYSLIHPYDNDDVIAGAGTASKELIEEIPHLDVIMTCVGGGGLLSGTSLYSKLAQKINKVYGAEPEGADDAYRSFVTGERVTDQVPKTIADGLRTTLSRRTFSYIRKHVDEIFRVNDTEIIGAMKFLFQRMKIVVEPSGAVPIAALIREPSYFDSKKVGIIISGGNIDFERFCKFVDDN